MNTITERVTYLDNKQKDNEHNFEVFDEGKWSNTKTHFSAFNDGGVECEVGEFLYSWVRLLKPQHVLETGTHWGVGASYMGLACQDNGFGVVQTYEFLQPNYDIAKRRIARLGLKDHVKIGLQDVGKLTPNNQFQFMLLDTEPQTRFNELIRFFDYLDEGGYVFIHDLHRHMHQINTEGHEFAWPYGELPKIIKTWVEIGTIRPFHFSTPRGLTGFYKVHEGDYKWQ